MYDFTTLLGLATVAGPISHRAVFRSHEPSLAGFLVAMLCLSTTTGAAIYLHEGSVISASTYTLKLLLVYLLSLSISILHYRVLDRSHPLHKVPGPVCVSHSQ